MGALGLALGLVWTACWPLSLAQTALPAGAHEQDAAVVKLLRPYLDDAYTPADGPGTDKDLIREFVRHIGEALPDKLAVKPSRPRRVLVVTQRTMGALHSPGAAGLLILLRKSAEKHKAFELAELTSDKPVTAGMLARFDAVVINNQSLPGDARFHRELLPEYVRNGGGLFAVHAAALIDSTGETDTEYNRLLGAYVDRSARYGHPGNHHSVFPIRLPLPNHPLARAFRAEQREYQLTYQELLGQKRRNYAVRLTAPSQLADELYVLLPAPGAADRPLVLVEIDARNSAVVYPPQCDRISHAITWIKPYGKGRVFYTQLGHNMAVFSIDTVARAMLDGLQYATGDLKAADDVQQEPFAVRNPAAFHRIVPEEARLETIGQDLGDAEGPVWIGGDDGYLVFSDIKADKVMK